MADQIFLVNSSSFQDLEISSSLRAGPVTIIDFTQAATFIARGDSITNVSASYIITGSNTSASYALQAETASYASNAITTPPESASWASQSLSASWSPSGDSTNATYAVSSSWATSSVSSSHANNADNAYAIDFVPVNATSASYASSSVSSSYASASSYLNPGATLWVVSGSNGVPAAFLAPYDYSLDNVYRPLPIREGNTHWDHKWNDWAVYDDSGARTHLGREIVIAVHNPTATSLPRLAPVYISGSSPSIVDDFPVTFKPDVYLAVADGTGEKSRVAGIVRQAIGSGSDGYILINGTMHNSNMAPYGAVGTELWLDPTTPGGLTSTKPGQPNEVVSLGYVIEAGSVGSFLVQLQTEPPPANAYAGMTSVPAIVDNTASYDVTISSGSVNLYNNVEGIGAITQYPVPAITFSVAPGLTASFVYATTNGVTSSYALTSNSTDINGTTKVLVATLYRADEDTHWIETQQEGLSLANKLNNRLRRVDKFTWESGFTLYETGSNNFVITEGSVWFGASNLSQQEFDSRLTGSSNLLYETHFAYHSASNWTIPTVPDGTYNNLYYDDGTNLVALAPSSWSVNYFYRVLGENPFDEDVFIIPSNNQYVDSVSAALDTVPASIPSVLEDVSILVGRIIFQSGSVGSGSVESAFVTSFGQSLVTQHNSLAGLQGGTGGQYYHMDLTDYTGTGTGVMVRQSGATLTNVIASGSLHGTSSWATNATTAGTANAISFVPTTAVSASWVSASNLINSASYASTASWAINAINGGTQLVTGSTYPITSSWAENAVNGGTTLVTGSTYPITASWAVSASWSPVVDSINATYAVSASWATSSVSSSYSITAATANAISFVPTNSLTSSWASSSVSSSFATTAATANAISFVPTNALSSSFASSSVSASYALVAGTANAISFVPVNATSASYASSSISASYAITAAFALDGTASFLTRNRTYEVTTSRAILSDTASYITIPFTRGGTFYDPLGLAGTAAENQNVVVWRAPFNCTITNVWGQRVSGSSAIVNAIINHAATSASTDISLTTENTWISASSLLTSSIVTGDTLEIRLVSSSAYPTQVAVQVDLSR